VQNKSQIQNDESCIQYEKLLKFKMIIFVLIFHAKSYPFADNFSNRKIHYLSVYFEKKLNYLSNFLIFCLYGNVLHAFNFCQQKKVPYF
jgi:hypothetical protein